MPLAAGGSAGSGAVENNVHPGVHDWLSTDYVVSVGSGRDLRSRRSHEAQKQRDGKRNNTQDRSSQAELPFPQVSR
jgi:hypothetical protein